MKEIEMDGFVTHRIEGVDVDIEVVPAAAQGFAARFRIGGNGTDETERHVVHVTQGPFATEAEAEEAAKSAALGWILSHGEPRH
jgi:hypothetical protein